MKDLIKELEAAEEGSSELDLKIMKALGLAPEDAALRYDGRDYVWERTKRKRAEDWPVWGQMMPFTSSLDAVWNALLEGWKWEKLVRLDNGEWSANIVFVDTVNRIANILHVNHKSLPIAMTIAILRAYEMATTKS